MVYYNYIKLKNDVVYLSIYIILIIMSCNYCGSKQHNISKCPIDNELVNLLYSPDPIDFESLSYKVLRKIASQTCYKTTLPKYELVSLFTKIKKKYMKSKEKKYCSGECAICFENIGKTNTCTTECGHTFCLTCILKLTKNNSSSSNKCPMCRESLLKVEEPNIIIYEEDMTSPLNNRNEIIFPLMDTSSIPGINDFDPLNLSTIFSQQIFEDTLIEHSSINIDENNQINRRNDPNEINERINYIQEIENE